MIFTNKIVLITGISSGIGKELFFKFIKEKAIVIGTTSKKNIISKMSNYLKSGFIKYVKLNNIDSINNLFKTLKNKYNHLDILINNSSVIKDKLLINMSEYDLNYVININLLSVFRMSKLSLKFMIKKKFGRIINIGSIVGSIGNVGQSNYASSKSGLIGFTKSLSKEVAKYGITVNIISPGLINTNMIKKIKYTKKKKFLSNIDMKRFGKINEVVNFIMFISSEKSSYITGEILNINGGM